jgi:hypothetical protein
MKIEVDQPEESMNSKFKEEFVVENPTLTTD